MAQITQLRVGIVGFGGAGMAQFGHFKRMEGCEVRAVLDTKPNGLERAAKLDSHLCLVDDWETFLSTGINTVAICSPDQTHAEYIIKAVSAGLHTVCEKPLCDSLDSCEKILAAASANPYHTNDCHTP